MADNDQILKILLKVEADVEGLKKTKKELDDLKGGIAGTVEKAAALGGALGVAIPTSFLGAMSTVIGLLNDFEAEQERVNAEMEEARNKLHEMQLATLASQEAFQKLAALKTQPLVQQIQILELELIRLKTELALAFQTGSKDAEQLAKQIQAVTGALETLKAMAAGAVVALKNKEALEFAQAYGTQADINRAKLKLLTDQVLAAHQATGTAISRGQAEQIAKDSIRAEEQNKIRAEAEREANARDSITPMLREQSTILQNIRQTQQLINEAPFMGVDAKQAALLSSSKQEMQNIARAIQQTQTVLKGSGLDETQYAQLEQRLQLLHFRFRQLAQDIPTLGFGGGLRAELTNWANSFGTTAQQVGKTIEQTIGASLQAVNQFLITGKFNAQALLQQLILLGLQLVEQMIIQRVMAAINAAASVGQAAATGPLVAAAWAPAATAATIATQGAAALQAPASVATALALIQGMLVIGHSGGAISRRMRKFHGGGLADDEVPIIAQEGEIMIRRDVAQHKGMAEFLLGLNAGEFHGGGAIRRMHDGGEDFGRWWEGAHDITITFPGDRIATLGPHWATEGLDPQMNRFITSTLPGLMLPGPFTPGGIFVTPMGNITTIGSSGYPRAIPVASGPDYGLIAPGHIHTPPKHAAHIGGLIRRMHSGGIINQLHSGGLITRMHSGGGVGSGSSGAAGIHIYAFTDLRQLTRHMAGKEGQKIIFDTVNGRRIDLGMK